MSGLTLATLWLAWVVGGGSPGPATLGIASTSMANGRHAGLAFALGILFGSAFWGIAAALGMGALMLTNAWLVEILRYLGAAYLLYLAAKSMKSAMSRQPKLIGETQTGSPWRIFVKGSLVHFTNPKPIFGWGAIYAIAVPPGSGLQELAFMFAFLYSGSILVFIGYAVLFSSARVVDGYSRLRRWFEAAFALLFGAASLKILTTRLT